MDFVERNGGKIEKWISHKWRVVDIVGYLWVNGEWLMVWLMVNSSYGS